jgi:dolichyl-phosphate beta-glucosyltransferase
MLYILAPVPRVALPSERKYITSSPSGKPTDPLPLPCWHDAWFEKLKKNNQDGIADTDAGAIDAAEVVMSVVIPAYNEEGRLEEMLEEAIEYLDEEYGRPKKGNKKANEQSEGLRSRGKTMATATSGPTGYEILLVDDGSRDKTVEVALRISQKHELHDILRVVSLEKNRGKGGAVTHGFRHVRGEYAIFADADGASKFSDLGKLVEGCRQVHDGSKRGVAVGSRAHMVRSEAVVKVCNLLQFPSCAGADPLQRSALRNILMHGFHLLLRLLTPSATSQIKDTQCGFKLFSRASLPYIIPFMHAEGWIFDVEMLMLAESAPVDVVGKRGPGIKVAEVAIGWKEIGGSKLNVMWDSLGMAWGLAILRLSWSLGVYSRG